MNKEKKCPACNDKSNIALKDKSLGLYKCNSCSHTFTVLQKQEMEKYSDCYFEEEHKNWFENQDYALYDFVHAKLSALLGEKKLRLLDVGCGNGEFLKHIRKKDKKAELWGIDLIENKCKGIHFIKCDFLKKKIPKRKFNAVCAFVVVEHISKPRQFAKKLNRVLEPGGYAVIMTIDNNSLIYVIARLLNKAKISTAYKRLYSKHHLQHYTEKSLKKIVENNGFETLLQKKRSIMFKAIDVPAKNFFTEKAYKLAAGAIFLVSKPLGREMLQIIICKKISEA